MLEGFLNFLCERQAIGALNIFHDQRVQKETNFLGLNSKQSIQWLNICEETAL